MARLLLFYPLAMSLALVYVAEHYVLDVLSGALVAGLVMLACGWLGVSRLDRTDDSRSVARSH